MTKAPDYGRYVARLLEKAEAAPSARPDLEESLERAQVEIFYLEMEEDKPPAELLNQVRNHVAKTIKLT